MAKFSSVEEYIASLDEPQRSTARAARQVIDAGLPGIGAALWHGNPVWSLCAPGKGPICLLKAYPRYVTFALWRGQQVEDPSGRLSTGAQNMAGVQLASVADIDEPLFLGWLRQARALEEGAAISTA